MELFKIGFVSVSIWDIIDIAISTFVFYKLYDVLKGTLALRVVSVLLSIFVFWKVVALLDLKLLKFILDQFLGLGAVAFVILFAPEIRRFLSVISKNLPISRLIRQVYLRTDMPIDDTMHKEIVESLRELRVKGDGALIVIIGQNTLREIQETGERLDADVSGKLIFSIFHKMSPLHDGAMVIQNHRITAVRCILPISDRPDVPAELGMRHRAAIGVSEMSDALVIVLSEERREISLVMQGKLKKNVDYQEVESAILMHLQQLIN